MAEPPEPTKHQNSIRLSILLPLRSIYFLSFVKKDLNTQYMTNSTLVSTVNIEYVTKKIYFEIPPCANHVIFITEFVLLIKTPPFYEVNPFNRKWLAHGGISK
jgi:hypothetical protein